MMWDRLHLRKWIRVLRTVRLTADERARMRCAVQAAMAAMPARRGSPALNAPARTTWWAWGVAVFRRPFPAAVLAVAVLAIVGSGVAIAAEQSLPGDVLYPVKVRVTEEVRVAIAVSPRARAVWHARRAERRIAEAEALAARGRLTAGARAVFDERFSVHLRAVERSTAAMEARGRVTSAIAIRSDLEAALRAHDAAMSRIIRSGAGADDLTSIQARVRATTTALTPVRAVAELQIARTGRLPRAEVRRHIRAAQRAARAAERALSRGAKRLDPEVTARVRAQLQSATESLDASRARLTAGASADAFLRADEALRAARQAAAFLRADEVLRPRRMRGPSKKETGARQRSSADNQGFLVGGSDDLRSSSKTTEKREKRTGVPRKR